MGPTESIINRRRMLGLLAGAGAAVIATACGSSGDAQSGENATSNSSTTSSADAAGAAGTTTPQVTADSTAVASASSTASAAAGDDATCDVIPTETGGPFPGDGSNGPNVRPLEGVVRRDIRQSFAGPTGVADGTQLEIELTITDSGDGCTPRPGAAVHLWHCDQDGRYSIYDIADENYLRGIAEADVDGVVRFTSIVPGCYAGRWPHIHFEVFESVADAIGTASPWVTSQLAFPEAKLAEAYTAVGYETSVSNLGKVSLKSDNVFGDDGGVHQLATMSGSTADGYTAKLTVNA
jgi:protocatechuate 3,4-dioxygenase beta subunit